MPNVLTEFCIEIFQAINKAAQPFAVTSLIASNILTNWQRLMKSNDEDDQYGLGSTIEVAGGRIAYESAGEGTAIVFIHAAIADRRMWGREMGFFANDHRVVSLDMRGYGGSTPATAPFSCVRDIRSLVSQLDIKRPVLAGCSAGGGFAVEYALAFPGEVGGLMLAAPGLPSTPYSAFGPEDKAAFDFDDRKSSEIADAWSKGDRQGALELLRQLWCSSLTGANRELFLLMAEQNIEEVFNDRSAKHLERGVPPYIRLGEIHVPTTVLVGDRDNPSSLPFARLVARGISGTRFVSIPGADHLINLSRPQEFEVELRSLAGRALS